MSLAQKIVNVFISCVLLWVLPCFSQNETIQKVKSFSYSTQFRTAEVRYLLYPATRIKKSTVLFLCGGPGFACSSFKPTNIPENFDIITVDYLGIGLNAGFDNGLEMQIESQGKMVAALIDSLDDKNVIIYATSFGTTVATVAGHLLDDKDILQGIILEGVVGPGLANYEKGYVDVADNVWSSLSETEKADFKDAYTEFSNSLNNDEKRSLNLYLTFDLQQGTTENIKNIKFFKSNVAYLKESISKFAANFSKLLSGSGLAHLRNAGCEIFFFNKNENKIYDGLFPVTTGLPKNLCENGVRSKVWNPRDYQIQSTPLIYLNGTQDPATPINWAREHYLSQKQNAKKFFISAENAGHAVLMDGMLSSCSNFIFVSISDGNFSDVIKNQSFIDSGCKN